MTLRSDDVRTATADTLTALVPFSVPMKLRFRRVEHRSGFLLRGSAGWAEFSPFPDYGPEVAARWLAAALATATSPPPPTRRTSVEVNATIPAVDAAHAFSLAAESGCRTAKVKVAEPGQQLADDVERVAAVRDALGAQAAVRIDANAAWDLPTASFALTRLDRAAGGLEYAEQPCATLEEMRDLRRRTSVLLAADESVRTADDPLRIVGLAAADLIVVKVQPLGGLRRALEVIVAAGLPAVVSSAVETSIGLATGVALAAALDDLPYACGLGTATLLQRDVVSEPLVPRDGMLPVDPLEPDVAKLAACFPGADEFRRLAARLLGAIGQLDTEQARLAPRLVALLESLETGGAQAELSPTE